VLPAISGSRLWQAGRLPSALKLDTFGIKLINVIVLGVVFQIAGLPQAILSLLFLKRH